MDNIFQLENRINSKETEIQKNIKEKQQRIEDEFPYISIDDEEYIDYHFYNPDFKFAPSVSDFKNNFINYSDGVDFVEVQFKCSRRKIFRNTLKLNLDIAEYIIVEVDNGFDIGTVTATGKKALERYNSIYKNENNISNVLRHANEDDISNFKKNINEEIVIIDKTKDLTKHYNLDMKICEAEWQLDRQRLTIYFTAPQRIDFRDLVKELARTFKTRIELRQISSREEAKRLGGIGPCGLCLCCTNITNENCHVTLDHARLQQLSNNVAKLSGFCGRLKCCLLYEHYHYIECFKKYPPLNSIIELSEGNARIIKVDIFKDITFLHIDSTNTYKTLSFSELEKLREEGKIQIPEKISSDFKNNFIFNDDFIDPDLLENDF